MPLPVARQKFAFERGHVHVAQGLGAARRPRIEEHVVDDQARAPGERPACVVKELCENAIDAVPGGAGTAFANDHTGCAPFGAEIVTRMREPARYAWPW